jgi:hypothetical protein
MLLGYTVTLVEFVPRVRESTVRSAADAAPRGPMRRDPRWARLEQAVLRALLPFAEARAAVCRELASAEAENST